MKYTGRLAKPIAQKRIGILADATAYEAEARRYVDEMFSKLPDLFHAHAVTEGDWMKLCLELAKAHVPGFKLTKPVGRKTEWGLVEKAEFKVDVDGIKNAGGLTVVKAIRQAILLEAWAQKASPMTIAALEKNYYEADSRFVQVVKDARAYESMVKTN